VRVYFAGPLFTPYERSFIDECAARLRADGTEVFVPHENALAAADTSPGTIFAKDWDGLSKADVVVALLDGPMVDDGTACEIGIFYGLMRTDESKKGIVGLVTDMRATRDAEHENDVRGLNLFVVGCIEAAGTICTSLDSAQAVLEGWRPSHPDDEQRSTKPS
jgi:nucleoside 2-deoxyribosyltransferase